MQNQANGSGATSLPPFKRTLMDYVIKILETEQPTAAELQAENGASGMFSYDTALSQAVSDWIKYKTEKRQGYKPKGLQTLLTQIQNNVDKYGNAAVIHAINESMASNYQGIVWDKAKAAAGSKAIANKGNQFFELAKELEQEAGGIYDY